MKKEKIRNCMDWVELAYKYNQLACAWHNMQKPNKYLFPVMEYRNNRRIRNAMMFWSNKHHHVKGLYPAYLIDNWYPVPLRTHVVENNVDKLNSSKAGSNYYSLQCKSYPLVGIAENLIQ